MVVEKNTAKGAKIVRVGARCRLCNRVESVDLTENQFIKFQMWEQRLILIQDAIPEVAPELREMFVSGTCPKCWDEMFGGDEDDE